MRHGTQGRRSRNRGHGGSNGGHNASQSGGPRRGTTNRNQIFDSNGPDVRIRGTAHQVCEKYLALAKDATSAGDIVLSESYMQHAEHYQRIINTWNDEFQSFQPRQDFTARTPQNEDDDLSLPVSILGGDPDAQPQPEARIERPQERDMLENA